MKICIMATSENVEAVRATAYENLPQLAGHQLLSYPVSSNGEEPVTHWACQVEANEELREKLRALQDLSDMEEMSLKSLLKKKNLKLVLPQ